MTSQIGRQVSPTKASTLRRSPISSSRTMTRPSRAMSSDPSRRSVEHRFPYFYSILVGRVGEIEIDNAFSPNDWSTILRVLARGQWSNLIDSVLHDNYEELMKLEEQLLDFYETEKEFIRVLYPWFAALVGIEVWNNDISHLTRAAMAEVIGFVRSVAIADWFAAKVEEPEELERIFDYRGSYEKAGIALVLYAIPGYQKSALATILSLQPESLKESTLIIVAQFEINAKTATEIAQLLIDRGSVDDLVILLGYSNISTTGTLIDSLCIELVKASNWDEDHLEMIDELRNLVYYQLSLLPDGEKTPAMRLEEEITRRGL